MAVRMISDTLLMAIKSSKLFQYWADTLSKLFTSNHVVEELFFVYLMLCTLEGVDGGGNQFIVMKEDGGGRAGMEGFNQDRMHSCARQESS
jgi:hypothetical protein